MLHDRPSQWIALDRLRRKLSIKHEFRRRLLKSLIKNSQTPLLYRYNALFKLSLIPRIASQNKIRNRCVISGRNYNVLKKTQYCRFVFRHNAYFASLPGVRRSSW